MKKHLIFLLACLLTTAAFSQHELDRYVPETDPLVLEKLEEWQGL